MIDQLQLRFGDGRERILCNHVGAVLDKYQNIMVHSTGSDDLRSSHVGSKEPSRLRSRSRGLSKR